MMGFLESNRRGDVSIGYMFVLIISALVMTAMTLISSNFISGSSDIAKEVQVHQITIMLEMEIEEAIYMGSNHPNAIYQKNVTLPKEIYGIQYRIELSHEFFYINGTHGDIHKKISISPPSRLSLSGSVPSTAGVVLISYNGNGLIEIK